MLMSFILRFVKGICRDKLITEHEILPFKITLIKKIYSRIILHLKSIILKFFSSFRKNNKMNYFYMITRL